MMEFHWIKICIYRDNKLVHKDSSIDRAEEWCLVNQVPLWLPVDFDLKVTADLRWRCVMEYEANIMRDLVKSAPKAEWLKLDKKMHDRIDNGVPLIHILNQHLYRFLNAENDIAEYINKTLKDIGFNVPSQWRHNQFIQQPKGII